MIEATHENLSQTDTNSVDQTSQNTTTRLEKANSWLGLQMGEANLIVNLSDVIEVLPVPYIQNVPLTKLWYLGVSNVRGNLYSVTDLSQFFGLSKTKEKLSNRIVLINSVQVTQAAILVDAVLGLRNVTVMKKISLHSAESEALNSQTKQLLETGMFMTDVYEDDDGKVWLKLDVDTLARDANFIQPSAT